MRRNGARRPNSIAALLLIIPSLANASAAQEGYARIDRLLSQARATAEYGTPAHYQEAILLLHEALRLAETGGIYSAEVEVSSTLGGVFARAAKTAPFLADSGFHYAHRARRVARNRLADPVSETKTLVMLAAMHAAAGRDDSTAVYDQLALESAEAAEDVERQVIQLIRLGARHFDGGRLADARARFERANSLSIVSEMPNERARALLGLGRIAQALDEPGRAGQLLREALAMATSAGDVGIQFLTLESLVEIEPTPDSAAALARTYAELARDAGDDYRRLAGLAHLGRLLVGPLNQWTQGLTVLDSASVVARRTGNLSAELGLQLHSGFIWRDLAQPREARRRFQRAAYLARTLGADSVLGAAHNGLGTVAFDLGEIEVALDHYRTALTLLPPGTPVFHAAQGNTAVVLGKARGPDSLLAFLEPVLERARMTGESEALGITQMYRGEALADRGNYAAAIRALEEAREHAKAVDLHLEANVLGRLAQVHMGPQDRFMVPRNASEAIRAFEAADSVSRLILLDSDADRLAWTSGTGGAHVQWERAWRARLSEPGADSSRFQFEALAVLERGRARALRELVQSADVRPPEEDYSANAVARTEAAYSGLVERGTAFLSYSIDGVGISAWLIGPTRQMVSFQARVALDSVETLVRRLHAGITTAVVNGASEDTSWRAPAAALSHLVFPSELEDWLPEGVEVVIAADGPLALVPFAALQLGANERPFGLRNAIRYAPSLWMLDDRARAQPGGTVADLPRGIALVVGNPTTMETPLYVAEREAIWVSEYFGSRPLLREEATELAVRDRLWNAPVIHLATHGRAYSSPRWAGQSHVNLAAGGPHLDERLTAEEIISAEPGRRMVAALVVLSACETGLGEARLGEGVVGLTRAFLARGARSVLSSLWKVEGAVTLDLVESFYEHWRDEDEPTQAEALRRAMVEVNSRHPHPGGWAAFQLTGLY